MATPSEELRREAEERVGNRFARQTEALSAHQSRQCEQDARVQTRAVLDSVIHEVSLESAKTQALEAHNRQWDKDKDRLAPKPAQALRFDLGGPPPRQLTKEYDELRTNWSAQRKNIIKDFDDRIQACKDARREMQQGFGIANVARNRAHAEDHRLLKQYQDKSFRKLVNKEIQRSDQWLNRQFEKGDGKGPPRGGGGAGKARDHDHER